MLSEKVINEILEDMKTNTLTSKGITRENGELIITECGTLINVKSNSTYDYIAFVPYDWNKENIDLRIRKRIAKEFIERHTFNELHEEYLKDRKVKEEELEKDINNVYKLEELQNKIQNLIGKYATSNNLNFFVGLNRHSIEIYVRKNNYQTDYYEIHNKDYDKIYNMYYDGKRKDYTEEEILEIVKNNVSVYEGYYNELKEKERLEQIEKDKKHKIRLLLTNDLKDNEIIIFKNKNSYIGYNGWSKFSLGTGKAGKFSKATKILDLILEKNINEYTISKDRMYSTEELKELEYSHIY